MLPHWKKNPILGLGIGVGLLGAVALAVSRGTRRSRREPIPDSISPTIFATRVAQTSKGQIVYHICGSGEPLLFLHGYFLGASSYEWSKVYCHFAMGREVIAPDLIGFGESERPSPAMDASDIADSIAELLRQVATNRPVALIASGLTCQIALLLASRHPELVARLVLFMPTTLRLSEQRSAMGMSKGLPFLKRFLYRNHISRAPFIKNWLTRLGFSKPENVTEETISILATCAQQYGAEHAILGFLRNRRRFHVEDRLGNVTAPVHILWPEAAKGFDLTEGSELCRKLPNASIHTLPEAGAFAPMEMPAEIGAAISGWLDADIPNASLA